MLLTEALAAFSEAVNSVATVHTRIADELGQVSYLNRGSPGFDSWPPLLHNLHFFCFFKQPSALLK